MTMFKCLLAFSHLSTHSIDAMNTSALVESFLGGKRALGTSPKTPADWDTLIRDGVPVGAVDVLKTSTAIADAELAALLGISEKTLYRARAAQSKLDSVASDRLYRFARIVALAVEVLEDQAAALHWLVRPQVGLGGRRPLALLTTEVGREQVESLLLRIEHGVYS
jgi:putative toxin-antitoxin system antitoxin component (TIGR02293 family)